MKVFYRLTSVPSTNPSPVYQDNKNELNWMCLSSFVEAYRDVWPDVTFFCDYCPSYYESVIHGLVPFPHTIVFSESGINGTAYRQFILAELCDDPYILFQECDYIYQPKIGIRMQEAIDELELVSPYDHRNFYLDKSIHSDTVLMKLVGDTHWRSTERNTLTFGIKNQVFKDHADIFKKYGYLDDGNWKELREEGHMLFVPIPSFATHMATDWMAPSVDWIQYYGQS